ncbi:MAG: FtsW/RodA/SpoVE family cell cycle protein [Bacteroidetes bacterium]|jgi:rod shape determining protein RodA|nr:FtsW/RodA/SpoVE family cell cycle protein [Bacteroidota bacterium]
MVQAKDFSWSVIVLWIGLFTTGLIAIYSATQGPVSEFLPSYISSNFFRQSLWIGISIVALIAVQFVSPRSFQWGAYLFYAVCILLMIITLFFGVEVSGSKSWLRIGPLNLQTGEITKVATILAAANYLTSRRDISTENLKTALTTVMIFLIPVALLLLQNEAGIAIVYLAILPVVLFWSGLPHGISLLMISPAIIGYFAVLDLIWGGIAAVIIAIAIFLLQRRAWLTITSIALGLVILVGTEIALNQVLQPHQRARIEAFANPSLDPLGAGWNVLQAKTAIGSGGLYGKGFMEGTQTQLRFLPEQWTDFIFCVVGEEFGFVGAGIVILLFGLLFLRMIRMAAAHNHPFAQLVIISVTFLFFIHFVINIGSATALLPIIGIPLPFISYGGSAFLTNTIMLAICLNLDANKRSFSIYS